MILEYPGVVGSGEIYLDVMKAICGDTSDKSMVDLMCHHAPYTPLLGFKECVYVDILDRGLDHKEEQKYFVKSDVFEFLWINSEIKKWDFIICSDGIEHLSKIDGHYLLGSIRMLSKSHIIFTPTRDSNLLNDDNPDSHKSSWEPTDFPPNYVIINFPDFHPSLNMGAFFAFGTSNAAQEFNRIKSEIENKKWAINYGSDKI